MDTMVKTMTTQPATEQSVLTYELFFTV